MDDTYMDPFDGRTPVFTKSLEERLNEAALQDEPGHTITQQIEGMGR